MVALLDVTKTTPGHVTQHMISPPDVEVQPVVGEEKESTTEERIVPASSSDQESTTETSRATTDSTTDSAQHSMADMHTKNRHATSDATAELQLVNPQRVSTSAKTSTAPRHVSWQ